MRPSRSISPWFLVLTCGGCEEERRQPVSAVKPAASPKTDRAAVSTTAASEPPAPGRAFVDERRQVPAGLEWNQEVGSRTGGAITFRVDSQGPFGFTVVSGEAHKAMMAGVKRQMTKADVMLIADSEGPLMRERSRFPWHVLSSWKTAPNRRWSSTFNVSQGS